MYIHLTKFVNLCYCALVSVYITDSARISRVCTLYQTLLFSSPLCNNINWQEHIDRAIELRPKEPILHYLNGRWCFEVAGLSWLEKKAAAALFATPPEATYEQALGYFMKSEELSPGTWKANMLMVGKVRYYGSHLMFVYSRSCVLCTEGSTLTRLCM